MMSDERIVQFGGIFIKLEEKKQKTEHWIRIDQLHKLSPSYNMFIITSYNSGKKTRHMITICKRAISTIWSRLLSPQVKQLAFNGHGFISIALSDKAGHLLTREEHKLSNCAYKVSVWGWQWLGGIGRGHHGNYIIIQQTSWSYSMENLCETGTVFTVVYQTRPQSYSGQKPRLDLKPWPWFKQSCKKGKWKKTTNERP